MGLFYNRSGQMLGGGTGIGAGEINYNAAPVKPAAPPPVDSKTLQKYHDFVGSTKQSERDLFFSHLNNLAQKGDTRSQYLLDNLKPLAKGKGTDYNPSLAGKISGAEISAVKHTVEPLAKGFTGQMQTNNRLGTLPWMNKAANAAASSTMVGSADTAGGPTEKEAAKNVATNAGQKRSDGAFTGQAAIYVGTGGVLKGGQKVVGKVIQGGKNALEAAARAKSVSDLNTVSKLADQYHQPRLGAPAETAAPKGLPAAGGSSAAPKRTPGGAVMVDSSSKEAQILQNAGKPTKIGDNPTRPGQNMTDITAPKVTKDQVTAAGRKVADGNLIQGSATAPAPKKDLGTLMQRWSDLRSGKVENTSRIGHINTLNDVIEHPHASQAVKDQAMAERDTLMGKNMQDKLATEHSLETGQPVASAHETLQAGHTPRGAIYHDIQSIIDDRAAQAGKRVPHDYVDEAAKPEPTPVAEDSPAAKGEVKDVPAWQKAARSGEGLLRSMGTAGKKLGQLMDKQGFDANALVNKYSRLAPTLNKLNKDEAAHLYDVVEKGVTPNSPKVAQAAKEWEQVRQAIISDAHTHGREVPDLGSTYLPHDLSEIFKDSKSFRHAAEQMVKSGEAKDLGEAVSKLREAQHYAKGAYKFANFDRHRTTSNLPYAKTLDAIHNYIEGSARAISQDKHFGVEHSKAHELLDQIGREGYDLKNAQRTFDYHVGNERVAPNKLAERLRAIQAITKLGRSAISNATQINNTQTLTGATNGLKGLIKGFRPKGEDARFIEDTGVAGHALDEIREQQGGVKGKLASWSMPLFNTVESFNRRSGALAGRSWADSLATKAAKGDKGSERILRDVLEVEGPIENGKLSRDQQIQAARMVVKRTQFLVGSKDLPHWMVNTQGGKTVSQFRSFSYKQQQFIADQVMRPAAKGNFAPLARYIAGTAVLGGAAYKTRAMINNTNTKQNSESTNVANMVQAAGGFGIFGDSVQNLIESSGYDHPGGGEKTAEAIAALIGGPQASDVITGGVAIKKATDGSTYGKLGLEKYAAGKVPIVGPRLAKTDLFSKTNVAIDQKTFGAMSGNDKINYLLKTSDKNRQRLLSQTDNKGVSVKDKLIKELLTDKKSIESMQTLTDTQKKAGAKPITTAQMKEALSKIGVNESDYSGQLDKIKKAASATSKAAYKTRKNTPKWKSPLLQ